MALLRAGDPGDSAATVAIPAASARRSGLSLRANFSWTLMGNVAYAGCQWGMLVVLAKAGSPVMVGQFALGLAITAPVIMFTNLQLRAVQATDVRGEYRFGDYFGLRLITTALALLSIATIILVSRSRGETALVILAIGLAKAFESISDVLYGLLQRHERMDRIAISMMVKGALSLAVLGGIVYLTRSVFAGAMGLAGAWAAILLLYDIPSGVLILKRASGHGAAGGVDYRALVRPRWERAPMTRLAWRAWPLGLAMMLISLNTNIPRYFIEHYRGERELGVFAALAYLMVAGTTVVIALGQAVMPRLAEYYAAEDGPAFRALLLRLIGVAALMGAVAVLAALLAGKFILTALYQPAYAAYSDVLIWLTLAAGIEFVSTALGYAIAATRAFSRYTIPYLSLTIITAAASWAFIPRYGLVGAAYALGISGLAGCAMPVLILLSLRRRGRSGPIPRMVD